MQNSEVVAYLDALEQDMLGHVKFIRELKLMVFEGLDNDDDDVLD